MARSSSAEERAALAVREGGKARVGRPTAERVEFIETQILDTARAHFLDMGFEATSVEAIAQSAGVSKGTLYARYPNKTALLRAVYERHSTEWVAQQKRDMGALPEAFPDRLKLHARRIVESLGSEEVHAFRSLVRRAGAPDGEIVRVFFEVGYAPTIEELAEEFARGGRQMGRPPQDPRQLAEMFMASLLGWHATHEFRGSEATPEERAQFADHVVGVILAGAAAW